MASSILFKFAFVLLAITLVLQLVGFSTDSWSTHHYSQQGLSADVSTRAGLWNQCYCLSSDPCVCKRFEKNFPDKDNIIIQKLVEESTGSGAWFQVVRALQCAGVAALIATGVLMIISICDWNSELFRPLAIICVFVAAAVILAGLIVYGVFLPDNILKYSYALCAVAIVFAILTGIVLLLDLCRRQTRTPKKLHVLNTHNMVSTQKTLELRKHEKEPVIVQGNNLVLISEDVAPPLPEKRVDYIETNDVTNEYVKHVELDLTEDEPYYPEPETVNYQSSSNRTYHIEYTGASYADNPKSDGMTYVTDYHQMTSQKTVPGNVYHVKMANADDYLY